MMCSSQDTNRFSDGMLPVEGVCTIALIGGMGAGKTFISGLFTQQNCLVVSLDAIGHDVLMHAPVINELVHAFGSEILDNDGKVVRSCLAAKAFKDEESTKLLNAITHPAIYAEAYHQIEASRGRYQAALVEVTSGDLSREALSWADAIVAVVAPESTRIKRAVIRGHDESDVIHRIAQQPSDDEFKCRADYLIHNEDDGVSPKQQVCEICQAIFDSYRCSHGFDS